MKLKTRAGLFKKSIALFLAAGITAVSLSGCQYESFDDYLRAVGILGPDLGEEDTQDIPEISFEDLTEDEPVTEETGSDTTEPSARRCSLELHRPPVRHVKIMQSRNTSGLRGTC